MRLHFVCTDAVSQVLFRFADKAVRDVCTDAVSQILSCFADKAVRDVCTGAVSQVLFRFADKAALNVSTDETPESDRAYTSLPTVTHDHDLFDFENVSSFAADIVSLSVLSSGTLS